MADHNAHDPFFITWTDIRDLLKRNKKKIFITASAFAMLGLWFSLTKPVKYVAEATFRERNKSQAALSNSMATLMMLGGPTKMESEAQTMMESRLLFEPIIKKMGLQAILGQAEPWSWDVLKRVKDNVTITYAYAMNKTTPALPDPRQDLAITNVNYNGELAAGFKIKFSSDERFDVMRGKQILGEGRIGNPFEFEGISFTVNPKDKTTLAKQEYSLILLPLRKAFEIYSPALNVAVDGQDSKLLNLNYAHSNRHMAAAIANAVMDQYVAFLNDVHHFQAEKQLAYLNHRQKESSGQLQEIMTKHADSLSQDLSENGFPDSHREMEFLAARLEKYKGQLLANELESKRLSSVCVSDCVHYDQYSTTGGDSAIINQSLNEIRNIQHQKSSLAAALEKGNLPLEEIQKESEFQGLTLTTAQELLLSYGRKLNEIEANRRQNEHLIERIHKPEFEVSSLSSMLTDPVSHEMIKKAGELDLALKDDSNRTQKEQERIRQELSVQKRFLKSHLEQTNQLFVLNEKLIKEKMQSLRKEMLLLSNQQITLLEKSLNDYIAKRLENLQQEHHLVEEYMDEVNNQMAHLPKKWVHEQLLKQEMDTNRQVVEELTKMVESKNITRHLELIQSTPIDAAIAPILPKSPRILLHMFLGALLGSFFCMSFLALRTMARGVPASLSNLGLLGQAVGGSFSTSYKKRSDRPPHDQDLEILRKLSSFASHPSLLLIEGNGKEYAADFAKLVAKRGGSVLLMSLCFDKPVDGPGLIQCIESSTPPNVVKLGDVDFLSSGGVSRYGNELLNSHHFSKLLNDLNNKYDWVIAYTHVKPGSSEAMLLQNHFAHVFVSITDETLEELNPYFALNKTASKKAAFVFS